MLTFNCRLEINTHLYATYSITNSRLVRQDDVLSKVAEHSIAHILPPILQALRGFVVTLCT